MNAGLVVLKDGTPCLAYEGLLPYPIRHVEFNPEDHRITIVFDAPRKKGKSLFMTKKEGKTFEFPVDPLFVNLFKTRNTIAVAAVNNEKLGDIRMYSLVFLK